VVTPAGQRQTGRAGAGVRRLGWLLAVPCLAGCAVERLVVDRVGNALADGGTVYAADDDPDLIAVASPFGLKLTESLLAKLPDHRGLLLAAARGFTQYAYAFVELPADETELSDVAAAGAARERARRLYLRARDYGLRGLSSRHPQFAQRLRADASAVLSQARRDDVALLYWTAAAWGAAISLGKNDPALLADLPLVQGLADRALQLDESFSDGTVHLLQVSLAASRPIPQGEQIATARQHFERAVALAGSRQAAPFVTYAEAIAIPGGRLDEFEQMLDRALAVDPAKAPEVRLANEIYQCRARWLRAHADQFFVR